MKRVLAVFSLIALMAIGAAAQSKGANFAGTWELDKAKSELPEMMQAIEGMTWTVTQSDAEVSRTQQVAGAMAGPGGGGGGRGGGRGMGNQPMTAKLDGTDNVVETPRGKTTITAKWMDGGKLEIKSVANISMQGNEFTMTTTEHWELADGGKVLKVHQVRETPRGEMTSKLVFNKK
ncbi:MAG: hypothetical protein AB7H86_06735 [Blastocatellales bacterium]